MKKIFTFCMMLLAAATISASNINLHLTGCTADEENPTEYTDEDEYGIDLNFVAEDGYTTDGWDVTVMAGEVEIPNGDWAAPSYIYEMASKGYLYIYYTGDLETDLDVTIICKEKGTGPVLPETFSVGNFEDIEIAENSVYRPATFSAGSNEWLTGAVLFRTDVQDYGDYGTYYFGSQAMSYEAGYVESDYSDAYLPSVVGAAEGKNYGSVNPSGAFEQIHFTKTTLSGMAVTNTAFNVNAILNGDYMSVEEEGTGLPFHQDDYFKLTIKGLSGEIVTGKVEFYLADFRTAGDWKYAENWQWVELAELGEIDGLQFELESTKKNNFGMTTAAYFNIDCVGGDKADCNLGEMSKVIPTGIENNSAAQPAQKMMLNGQLQIRRGEHIYNAAGQVIR